LPFSAGSQLDFGGEYDAGVAENPKMSPRSPVVDCDTGAAPAAPVAATSPPSCRKICITLHIQDETTHLLLWFVRHAERQGLRFISHFNIIPTNIIPVFIT
jgi:hypothetical protein